MVTDALKGYMQLASGLTDVTKDRATAAVKGLAAQRPDLIDTAAATAASATSSAMSLAVQLQAAAEELVVTSKDNRALLVGLIRTEVERVVAALGFAKEAEVEAVRHKVDRLEGSLDDRAADAASAASTDLRAALAPASKAAKKKAAKKSPAKKTTAKKTTAKKVPAKKVPAKKVPAAKAAAKKPPVKKAPAPASAAPAAPVDTAPVDTAPATPAPAPPLATPAPVTPAPVTPAPVTPAPVTPAPWACASASAGARFSRPVARGGADTVIESDTHTATGSDPAPERADAGTQLSVLPTPAPGPSGLPDVDAALARLGDLGSTGGDLTEHVAIYEDVHTQLASALAPDDPDPGTDESARQD